LQRTRPCLLCANSGHRERPEASSGILKRAAFPPGSPFAFDTAVSANWNFSLKRPSFCHHPVRK
jgi:hypothetical protein